MSNRQATRRKKLRREAEGYLELGLPHSALAALARLGDPTALDPHALFLWGEALRCLGRFDEALVPLRQASQQNPDDVRVWLALGWCFKRTGRIEAAIDALEHALPADPDEPLLHYNLSCYCSLAGQKENALRHLSRALTLKPDMREMIATETDFAPLRNDPEFQAICRGETLAK